MSTPVGAYEEDPYRRRLGSEVLELGCQDEKNWAALSDTILYPEGGGQPADRGWINGIRVTDVQVVQGKLRHYLEKPVETGPVEVTLDWERRFDHMQQHTGQHLLTAVAADQFGWNTTAFHLGQKVSDVELDAPALSPQQLEALEEAVASHIRAARQVRTRRVTPQEFETLKVRTRGLPAGHRGSIRLVEIEGVDLNTCGGTHLGSTAELEALKLLGTDSMRGGSRLRFLAGKRLRRHLALSEARCAELRTLLCVGDKSLAATLATKLEQLKRALREQRILEEELALATAEGLSAAASNFVASHFQSRNMSFLQRVARNLVRKAPGKVALLTATSDGSSGVFVLAKGSEISFDLRRRGQEVAKTLEGRGGGSGQIFQGKAGCISNRAEAVAGLRKLVEGSE
ncbi:MAG: alanyl-tRNA editing protein [Acidobacteriota bacterium]